MRRKEKEIADTAGIEAVLMKARICRLGLIDGDVAYIVPLNFGYRDRSLYFHTAREGKKIDLLRKRGRVSFEVEADVEIIESKAACGWGTRFRCVMGTGRAEILEDGADREAGLRVLMDHHSPGTEWDFQDASLDKVAVIRLTIEEMSGKKSGY